MAQTPEFLTSAEVAAMARLSVATIDRYARAGSLKGRRVGKSWRFTEAEVREFLGLEAAS